MVGAESVALVLSALAVSLAAIACAAATWAAWSNSGARVTGLERAMGTALNALRERVEGAESIVRSSADEAAVWFERAEGARKRAQSDRVRAERAIESREAHGTAEEQQAAAIAAMSPEDRRELEKRQVAVKLGMRAV